MRLFSFKTYTFGCRVNQAETSQIENGLIKAGFQPVKENQLPDIIIINTCVVTKKAEKEDRQLTRRVRRENPNCFLVHCGCAVNFWYKVGFPKLPVDLSIKNEDKIKIAKILKQKLFTVRHPELDSGSREIPKQVRNDSGRTNSLTDRYQQPSRRIIKIQDGCNQFCSFCIVPYLRRKPKSKKIRQIVEEAKQAEKKGIKEIVLSGINVGLFGQDTNETIPMLLKQLLEKTSIPRICFGSIYPEVINQEFIKLHIKDWQEGRGRLYHFFHLPLQSGSEKILNLMNRKYSLKKFESIVKKLHRALPRALIATDVIVGFPGEGEQEFRETYKFLKEMPISRFHVFRFSPRKGTVAYKMEKEWGRVDEKTKKRRSKILRKMAEKKYQDFLKVAKKHSL